MSSSLDRTRVLPARSFAQFVLDHDCQFHWEVNEHPEELSVFIDDPLLERLRSCLQEGLATSSQGNGECVPDLNLMAGLMGRAVEQALLHRDPQVLNPYLSSRLRLHHVGWFASTDLLDDKKAYSAPRLFWIDNDTLMSRSDDPYFDKWVSAWAALIQKHYPYASSGRFDFEAVKTWWTQAKASFRVTQRTLPSVWMTPALSSLPRTPGERYGFPSLAPLLATMMTDPSRAILPPLDDLDDPAVPEIAEPAAAIPEPQPTHRVVDPADFQASHPNGHDNDWCKRLIQRLGELPLKQWPTGDQQGLSALRLEFPWADAALDHLALVMAFWRKIGGGVIRVPPLLLVGPAGCGKSRLAKRLGECLGLPSMIVSAIGGGAQQIKGTERAWSNGTPSSLVRFIADHHCPNPLIVVDEIDKQEENRQAGTLRHALLGLTEPENARVFRDSFLETPCDLSAINWVMTANDLSALDGPFLSRMEVIRMGHPRTEHLPGIAMGVRTDLARVARCTLDQLPWTAQDERWVREHMGQMFSAREARKLIEKRLMVSVAHERPALHAVPEVIEAVAVAEANHSAGPRTATVTPLHRPAGRDS